MFRTFELISVCFAGCSIGGDDAKSFYTEWNDASESFDEMNLHENLLRGIYAYGALCIALSGGLVDLLSLVVNAC